MCIYITQCLFLSFFSRFTIISVSFIQTIYYFNLYTTVQTEGENEINDYISYPNWFSIWIKECKDDNELQNQTLSTQSCPYIQNLGSFIQTINCINVLYCKIISQSNFNKVQYLFIQNLTTVTIYNMVINCLSGFKYLK